MWVFDVLHDCDIVQLDVQVLIHALQCSSDGYVVLQFDGDLMIDERLEKAVADEISKVHCIIARRFQTYLKNSMTLDGAVTYVSSAARELRNEIKKL